MIVDELPTGSWILFFANIFISYFFQFIGFLFTYLLHTTHAAKYGSRVGLGLTLIQFGFQSRRREELVEVGTMSSSWNETMGMMPGVEGTDSNGLTPVTYPNGTTVEIPLEAIDISSRDWVSFLLMTLGELSAVLNIYLFFNYDQFPQAGSSYSRPLLVISV